MRPDFTPIFLNTGEYFFTGERIDRCVMTEIGESVRIFWKNLLGRNVILVAVV